MGCNIDCILLLKHHYSSPWTILRTCSMTFQTPHSDLALKESLEACHVDKFSTRPCGSVWIYFSKHIPPVFFFSKSKHATLHTQESEQTNTQKHTKHHPVEQRPRLPPNDRFLLRKSCKKFLLYTQTELPVICLYETFKRLNLKGFVFCLF